MTRTPENTVDWEWANQRLTLPIRDAVALSLGCEISTLVIPNPKWNSNPLVAPTEYLGRVAQTYEAVRAGALVSLTTDQKSTPFDINADFFDAQHWEVSLVEFRRFCDGRCWSVPEQFAPNGYVVSPPLSVHVASSIQAPNDVPLHEHQRRLARFYALGGRLEGSPKNPRFVGFESLIRAEKDEKRSRIDKKTVRKDLLRALKEEQEAKREGANTRPNLASPFPWSNI